MCYLTLSAFVRRLTFLNIDVDSFDSGGILGGLSSKYDSDTPRRLTLHKLQALMGGKFAIPSGARFCLYVRTLVSI